MKKLFTLLALIATIATFAQAPQGFNYQATVRNSSGQLLLNQIVLVKFNILQNSAIGTIVYSETQTANTDDLGQINLVVGQGTAPTGTFSTINWGSGSYYLGIELNTGSGYVAMGTTQLLSVPYALYAKSSGINATVGTISSISNPSGATITSGELNLSPADATNGGVITTGIQTIAGAKTFSSDLNVNGITVGLGTGNIDSNTAIGKSVLVSNTTGKWNTATGINALYSNTTGFGNTSNGFNSLYSNIDGVYNTASGYQALYFNTSGNTNSAFGRRALHMNTSGAYNTATGNSTLMGNTTGNGNTATGEAALSSNTVGNNNTSIGWLSLYRNITGSNNTAIGNQADVLTSGLTNATAIGYISRVAASNTIQLGNTDVTTVNTSGNYKGAAFVKNGGTASQYLMADGSVTNGSKVIGVLGFDDINANSHINTYETTQISPLIYSRYFYGQYGDLVIQGQPSLYDGKIHFVTGSDKVGQDPPTQRMVIMSNGNIGIGNFLSSPPKSKLEVQNGDVYIDNSSKGIILKSPNGNCWRVTIDNAGNFIRTNISCPN